MRSRSWALAGVVAVALGVLFAPATAGAQSRRSLQRARILFAKGVQQYDRGRFLPALRSFTRAYQIAPAPAVIFNIAQCHLSLGHDADAARHFRLFLEQVPDAPNRREVERRLREIDARIAAQRRDRELRAMADVRDEQDRLDRREAVDDEPAPSSGTPDRGGGLGIVTWMVIGAGVATAGVGGLFAWDAAAKQSDLDEPSLDCSRSIRHCLDLVAAGDRSATLRTVLLSTGGALLAAGIVMLVIDLGSSGDDREAVLAPRLGPGLAMFEARASW